DPVSAFRTPQAGNAKARMVLNGEREPVSGTGSANHEKTTIATSKGAMARSRLCCALLGIGLGDCGFRMAVPASAALLPLLPAIDSEGLGAVGDVGTRSRRAGPRSIWIRPHDLPARRLAHRTLDCAAPFIPSDLADDSRKR